MICHTKTKGFAMQFQTLRFPQWHTIISLLIFHMIDMVEDLAC